MDAVVVGAGMTITLFRWKNLDEGDGLHPRYILTDVGGIRMDKGFRSLADESPELILMEFEMVCECLRALDRDTTKYELVEPVLQIAPNGYVEEV